MPICLFPSFLSKRNEQESRFSQKLRYGTQDLFRPTLTQKEAPVERIASFLTKSERKAVFQRINMMTRRTTQDHYPVYKTLSLQGTLERDYASCLNFFSHSQSDDTIVFSSGCLHGPCFFFEFDLKTSTTGKYLRVMRPPEDAHFMRNPIVHLNQGKYLVQHANDTCSIVDMEGQTVRQNVPQRQNLVCQTMIDGDQLVSYDRTTRDLIFFDLNQNRELKRISLADYSEFMFRIAQNGCAVFLKYDKEKKIVFLQKLNLQSGQWKPEMVLQENVTKELKFHITKTGFILIQDIIKNSISIYHMDCPEKISTLNGKESKYQFDLNRSFDVSNEQEQLLVTFSSQKNAICIWDIQTGECEKEIDGGGFFSIVKCSDTGLLAVIQDGLFSQKKMKIYKIGKKYRAQ